MSANFSRRVFLKGGLTAACGLAASQLPLKEALAAPSQKTLATLLDLSKCVACGSCVEACHETNGHKYPNPQKPFPKMYPSRVKAEDWTDKQDVDDRLTPYNWLYIQTAEVEHQGESIEVNIPRRCMHCSNPPCVKLCPWGAARQYDNGIAQIDADLCMGGAKCRTVCPWQIPQRQTGVGLYLDLMPAYAGNGVMYKCDRCYDRVAQGELPACIEACPEEVQTIGPHDEIIHQAHALVKEMNGYIYGETENGGTNTIYVSPVPFEKLNKAIETGKGKPHLNPVADTMAGNNNLARAMLLAPLAGLAAAVGKFYKFTKNNDQGEE
jgi:Fe-S-cluster-containing dehydrogenase component